MSDRRFAPAEMQALGKTLCACGHGADEHALVYPYPHDAVSGYGDGERRRDCPCSAFRLPDGTPAPWDPIGPKVRDKIEDEDELEKLPDGTLLASVDAEGRELGVCRLSSYTVTSSRYGPDRTIQLEWVGNDITTFRGEMRELQVFPLIIRWLPDA